MTTSVDLTGILSIVTRDRLYDLARVFGIRLRPGRESKVDLAQRLAKVLGDDRLSDVLSELGRDELQAVCRAASLSDDARAREDLIRLLATAAGVTVTATPKVATSGEGVPRRDQVLTARGRQWLVEEVVDGNADQSPLLRLACLDDDAPGRRLEILWDLELGARVVEPATHGIGDPRTLDPPAHFGAYLHAIKWSAVSAADATRFQAPFRAGIKIMNHQLTPLMKALELPRANLFIADDVGLGKTIEAGLVLQELILRQQAGFVLIVCPASICLQWRDEMMRRFGLRFEVMTLKLQARRRVERGFGVNPWSTHNRFIISHPLIRRPDYRDPLLAHLGHRAEKGLLILDEAHVAAPASASKYAVDSDTTRTLRDLAPKFDNRLFLSATPHNGHSNSFSALLEILDPIRFTRGVEISGPEDLAPVMVRRLKRDLRQLGFDQFPERILVRIDLTHGDGGWQAVEQRYSAETGTLDEPQSLADRQPLGGDADEIDLAQLLARYTELCAPKKGRGQLVFINLQKRLLSSPEAFARTLEVHARAVDKAGGVSVKAPQPTLAFEPSIDDPDTYGVDDETLAVDDDEAVRTASAELASLSEQASAILKEMRVRAERARRVPDAKARALLAWLHAHCCPAITVDGKAERQKAKDRAWSDRRVILFTEYGDTKRYLHEILTAAIAHTDRADERILAYHGGMGDDTREVIQRAFNTQPADHPARILIATDAAREGVNLQAHCADLFHIDIPWNPSRMEQRNGRIDRVLQPAKEVRCHYFVFPQREEDRVLATLVKKIDTVQRELGSVGAVLLDEMEKALSSGIKGDTEELLKRIGDDNRSKTAASVLEAQRKQIARDVAKAGRRLEESRKLLAVDPQSLRGVVEIGLALAGAAPLVEAGATDDGRPTYTLPDLDRSWQETLDTLRPPRGRDEPFWEWRKRPPKIVTFDPLQTLSQEAEQLHLAHPFVRRILDRFLAQGYGAHDLSRVASVVVEGESVARAIAYARLTLFGHGAARLHDELIAVVAPWEEGDEAIVPDKDAVTAAVALKATEQALANGAPAPGERTRGAIKRAAPKIYAALWPVLEVEADARATDARNGLAQRARKESDDLRALLERQRGAVAEARTKLAQMTIAEVIDKLQKRQVELDIEHLGLREAQMQDDLVAEPLKIEALYEVQMKRLTPVGLVIAWPEGMT